SPEHVRAPPLSASCRALRRFPPPRSSTRPPADRDPPPSPTPPPPHPANTALPQQLDIPANTADMQLRIEGEVTGSSPRMVVLRVDDGRSTGYGSRENDEHRLPPGPISWTVRLDRLRTHNNRAIHPRDP